MNSKVLLVVIDAATPHVVCPAIHTGRLPVMQRLMNAGTLHESSVTIFPSITPAATSTIITGAYPAEHGIAGASWYDSVREEVAYYGDDFWIILRQGFGHFINDFLLRLNGDRLKAPTLFEMVERAGRQAACLNYLVFRGNVPHRVAMPGLIAALPGVPFTETIEGPSLLSLGDFVNPHVERTGKVDKEGGVFHRFGMDDASTGAMLRDLAGADALPDFTVAYFADNDYVSHDVGPVNALPVIERVDRMLGEMFEAARGMERFLSDRTVIVTSDHGHCDVRGDRAAVIRLDHLLSNFRQADLGRAWKKQDEIMICPNMRASQIYVKEPTRERIERIAVAILENPCIDQIIWRSHLTGGGKGYMVVTHRGRMQFSRDGGSASAPDTFGGTWEWSGDPEALDLQQDGRTTEFGDYPNAFERISGVLDLDKSGEIWVTARPGCEFQVPGGEAHAGGASHGALHKLDSLSPVLVAGAGAPKRLPRHMRSLDIAPLCMEILGIPMRYRVGDPRN
ncbi:MAG: nucleotide pyrophosphatase/phosphodiesterase family protein [Vicinamibacterales bacterium]